jgi:anti-sigma regulatory factor (Ser/Thr protein kinase)
MEPLTVPATLDSLGPIGKYVLAVATSAGLDNVAAYRLRGAVDEIATNVITHGDPDSAAPGMITVRAQSDGARLSVILEDSAAPFDPRSVAPPDDVHLPAAQRQLGGLGIYLAINGVDCFHYERVQDRNRSVFTMNCPGRRTQP